jgi:hypothetical protein
MHKKINILLTLLLFVVATSSQGQQRKAGKKHKSMTNIERFKQYITGDFDNSAQLHQEMAAGKIIHPFAVHVNRICDQKISNRPAQLNGFFVLEESYYLYEGKPMEAKPYLFYFAPKDDSTVQLTVYQWPESIAKEARRNNNDSLQLNFLQLQVSPTFKGATYVWDAATQTYSTTAVNDLPNQMRFTLNERFSSQQLQVMELLEKEGKRLTPYTTPILYDRK